MYRAKIWEAARGLERIDEGGPIAFCARVPQTGVAGRGMLNGANPCPFHLIVHVDCYRRGAKEKVANAHVGDVESLDRLREAKSASGEPGKHPSRQSGYGSKTWSVFHEGSFVWLQVFPRFGLPGPRPAIRQGEPR